MLPISTASMSKDENNKTAIAHWQLYQIARHLKIDIKQLFEEA